MSYSYIPGKLKKLVKDRASEVCEYCCIPESSSMVVFQFDHIISEKLGGFTNEINLAYSCPDCNRFKGSNISSYTGSPPKNTPLYNPRSDHWNDHFFYTEDGNLHAKSVTGEGTIFVLGINLTDRIKDRAYLFQSGLMKLK